MLMANSMLNVNYMIKADTSMLKANSMQKVNAIIRAKSRRRANSIRATCNSMLHRYTVLLVIERLPAQSVSFKSR